MFQLNDDLSIYATRGDIVYFSVSAVDRETKEPHKFQPGDVLRCKVYGRKDAESVYAQADFPVTSVCEKVDIYLDEEYTKIGDIISKPVDYWYEVELNPDSEPQTIIGYDEDGAKVFKLFPEGADIESYEPDPEDFPVVDDELDTSSPRPISNRAVASALIGLIASLETTQKAVAELYVTPKLFGAIGDGEADDTEAMQDAMDYAIDHNTELYIPAGQYRITKTLTLKDTLNMRGNGQSTQNTKMSTLLFDAGDQDIPLIQEAEGVTQVGRCTFANVSFIRQRTEQDGYNKETAPLVYGKSGTCIGFNSNESSFHRCTFVGFNAVLKKGSITDFVDCDIVYCNSVIANDTLCNSISFYGGNFYACGTLLRANGNLSVVNFTDCWIEDFVTLMETRGVSILGLNFTGCTLTNTVNGGTMLVYTDTPSFAREFINFTGCLLHIKGQICDNLPKAIEFGMTFDNCAVYYGGTGETISIYGNSKFLTLAGANLTPMVNAGFNTRNCQSFEPIEFSPVSLTNDRQIGKPNNYIETKDGNGNRMLMLPVYYEFVENPYFSKYFVFNTQAVSTGDWVLRFIYEATSGTVTKDIVVL